MRTELFFKDIRRSEYAENFINDKVENLTDKLIQPDSDSHVVVRVQKNRQRTTNRHGLYQCDITVKSGISNKTYKVTRQDRNLYRAIVSSFDALKSILAKNHDRQRNDRRRRRLPDFTKYTPPPMPPTPS